MQITITNTRLCKSYVALVFPYFERCARLREEVHSIILKVLPSGTCRRSEFDLLCRRAEGEAGKVEMSVSVRAPRDGIHTIGCSCAGPDDRTSKVLHSRNRLRLRGRSSDRRSIARRFQTRSGPPEGEWMSRFFFLDFDATLTEIGLVRTACPVREHVEASLHSLAVSSTLNEAETRHSPSLAWTGTGRNFEWIFQALPDPPLT